MPAQAPKSPAKEPKATKRRAMCFLKGLQFSGSPGSSEGWGIKIVCRVCQCLAMAGTAQALTFPSLANLRPVKLPRFSTLVSSVNKTSPLSRSIYNGQRRTISGMWQWGANLVNVMSKVVWSVLLLKLNMIFFRHVWTRVFTT